MTTFIKEKKLLIVGPLPPPIGGSPLTLKVMLDELANYPEISTLVINTSPTRSVNKKMTGFNFEKVKRMFSILTKFRKEIRNYDTVLVFANDLFAFILVPLLIGLAHKHKKAIFLKPVGSNIDLFIRDKGKFVGFLMMKMLKSADGILSQTKYLTHWLIEQGCKKSYYLPGARPYDPFTPDNKKSVDGIKAIFLGHITLEKGPLVLLDALQIIENRKKVKVSCDFYGPVHDDVSQAFFLGLQKTAHAQYMGVVEAGKGSEIIAQYDVLVLPTCYDSEGHPGVLIEAMHASVPVITTQKRTLTELVTPGENGLLVPAGDALPLAEALETMAVDGEQRLQMGKANFLKGQEFRSDVVVKKMLQILFPD